MNIMELFKKEVDQSNKNLHVCLDLTTPVYSCCQN